MRGRLGRRLLRALYAAALRGVDPERLVREALGSPEIRRAVAGARRIGIFAVGKAAAGMALGAGDRVEATERLVILPRGAAAPPALRASTLFAAHPDPDRSSGRAARRALTFFRGFGRHDLILCLVSGGASSLLALPRSGIPLARKRRAIERLARSGASILALNRLRTSLSAVKGGRLGRATRARLITLVLSDVPGDRAAVVGSGPTVRHRRGDIVRVVGSNRTGLDAVAREARRLGLKVRRLGFRLSGDAAAAGRRIAREIRKLPPRTVLLAGGETTVRLEGASSRRAKSPEVTEGGGARRGSESAARDQARGRGRIRPSREPVAQPGPEQALATRGGRSLELALAAAAAMSGGPRAVLLAAGSDGRDGSSDAAGAFADQETITSARRLGLDPESALSRHDAHPFFGRLELLLRTGPTGTNVADWVFAVRSGGAGVGQ